MPRSLSTSSLVASTKDKKSGSRKCKKPCQSSSSSSCCTEQCIDCCTSQYQRLSVVKNLVADAQIHNDWSVETEVYNRCGLAILHPDVSGAYANESGCTGANEPENLNDGDYQVANLAYYFVNEFAYGPYEPGCHNDQVYGWYVDVESGELQLFMQYEGVPTNATRACLTNDLTTDLTSAQKRQLKVLNKLYKLSKSAVKEVNGIPSQEGNIVEVCDCKGERWLLYIDTAAAQTSSPLATCNYEFAIVATKLC
jgi:hypothetical protein